MAYLKTFIASLVLALNTLLGFCLMLPFALLKLLLPLKAMRALCDHALNAIASNWISINSAWIQAINGTRWQVSGIDGLDPKGWYLVIGNHQSWVDILALQHVFNRRIPLLKFFIKHELIYVPIIGLAWWALDFPFMKRRGGASVQQDLAAARKSCEKFRLVPTSVISFAEGTRFTADKHAAQKSPFRHLLKPKSGGVGMALETMGDMFTHVLDVTIAYPQGVPTFADILAGRCREVIVHIEQLPVPSELRPAAERPISPVAMQRWVLKLWKRKDALLDEWLPASPDADVPPGQP